MGNARILIAFGDEKFSNPIIYTFGSIFSILGIKYEIMPYSGLTREITDKFHVLISYGFEKGNINAKHHIHIYQSKLFGKDYKTLESMPELPLKRWNGLPIIYEGKGDMGNPVIKNGNIIETNIDIIASSFFMLSRYEETMIDERDIYNRFPAESSIAYKEDFLSRPIVNNYIDLLWNWIESFNIGFERKKFWGNKDFAVCLTHDVDDLGIWKWRNIVRKMKFLLEKPGTIPRLAAVKFGYKDPYWELYYAFIETEKSYGFSSSFYFLAGGENIYDADYSIKVGKVLRIISRIREMGNEIGLHGSFDSYNNLEILSREKENLQEMIGEIFSIRQHFLRFDVGKTYAIYEKLGIKCDVTLGFAQSEGFRAGICFPFHPYNIEEDGAFDLIEIPLTVMDGTLINYKHLDFEKAWQNTRSLLESVKNHNGCAVLLWHKKIDIPEEPYCLEVYKKSLEWIAENNGLGMSVKEVFDYFRPNPPD